MIADPRRHAAHQLFKSVSSLEAIADLRRETYFLDGPMANADRVARQVKLLRPPQAKAERLQIDSDNLMKRFEQYSRRLEKLRAVLDRMHEARGDEGPRSLPVRKRRIPEPMARKDQR
jgi:predicted RNase H-like nuclease (RuvC/YqgF family)